MKAIKDIFLFTILLMITCTLQAKSDEPIIIDIAQMEEGEIPVSRLVSKVEYIPLELTKECPLTKGAYFYVTSQYILGMNFGKHIYLFDRKDGRFVKEISKRGYGPDDYFFTLMEYAFDYKRHVLYVDCMIMWRGIDILTGKCVEQIIKPSYRYEKEGLYQGAINNPYFYKNKYYIGFNNNTTGKIKEKILFFDKEGKVLKSFLNTSFFEQTSSETYMNPGLFYEYKDEVYLLPGLQNPDTVFHIKNDNLYPHILFKLGNEKVNVKYETTKLAGTPYTYEKENDKVSVSFVEETDRYMFFRFVTGGPFNRTSSNGYYDKKSKKAYRTPFKKYKDSGFTDDIHGLLPLNIENLPPSKKIVVGWLDVNTLNEEYELGRIKPLTEVGKKIAGQTKYDDNPIIVIATLK